MRRLCAWVAIVGLGGLATIGCVDAPKRVVIKPPRDEFHTPPDSLSKGAVKYPNEILNNVAPRKLKDDDKMPPIGGGQGVGLGNGSMGMNGLGR